nr:hypothetical protein [Tanacetum cinerariifolium]
SLEDFKAKRNIEKVQEQIMDEELDHLLDGNENVDENAFMDYIFNNQEDLGTRIEPRGDKESPKAKINAHIVPISTNEEEEESPRDEFELKRRENGKGIEETRDTPPLTPIRSPRTPTASLFIDKNTLQELTVITEDAYSSSDKEKLKESMISKPIHSYSTPSLSSPKPKIVRFK